MEINKKLSTILLGIGISISSLNVFADAKTSDCDTSYSWCIASITEEPGTFWYKKAYQTCSQSYIDCLTFEGGWG